MSEKEIECSSMTTQIRRGNLELPAIFLGTSPFYGFVQFGSERASEYGRRFSEANNIVDVVKEAIVAGVEGIQIVSPEVIHEPFFKKIGKAEPQLIESVIRAEQESGVRLQAISTVFTEEGIEIVSSLRNKALLIDGNVTDNTQTVGFNEIIDIQRLRKLGHAIGNVTDFWGVVTHCPATTLPKLKKEPDLWERINIIMTPINEIGYRTKPRWDEGCERTLEEARNDGKIVIAMKALAAGRIPPRRAIEYVSQKSYVDGLTIGVASKEEAAETFRIAVEVWKNRRTG
jgi:hypothetical protein